jgi:RND family efflux transporter MFP subunit
MNNAEMAICSSALLLAGFVLAGCQPAEEPGANAAGPDTSVSARESLPKVTTIQPSRQPIVQTSTQPGRIEAFSRTPVHAKVGGYADRVLVDIGDRVTGPLRDSNGAITQPGQVLAVLSAPEIDEELRQKAAVVAQVEAEILQAEAAVRVAQSLAESALAGLQQATAGQERAEAVYERWTSEVTRMRNLAESQTVTAKLADEAEMQLKSADAARAEAQAQLRSAEAAVREAAVGVEKAEADVRAMHARLTVAGADRDRIAAMREYLTIRAPFDGIVTERHVDPGHLVQPSRNADETPLFVVVQADKVRVFVDVPEAEAALVETGRPATIAINAAGSEPVAATVARTSWALQSGTRSLMCELDVPNADGRLRPGMFATVELRVAEAAEALVVPRTAIVAKDGQSFVVTVTADGTIRRIAVKTGIRSATEIEIVSGLTGAERVLTANAAAFQDGQKVETATP